MWEFSFHFEQGLIDLPLERVSSHGLFTRNVHPSQDLIDFVSPKWEVHFPDLA